MSGRGEMLRLARQRKGFHQTEAAKLLGIDQSMLSRIENGVVEARYDLTLKASQVYDLPLSFFEQHEPIYGAPVSVHPMWRKKADVTARELDKIIAELNVRVMHLRKFFDGAAVANTNDLPRMDIEDYKSPEDIAALVRAHWKVPSGPIRDVTLLAEKAGVLVAHSNLGEASVSGVTFSVPGMPPLIVLNSDQPADRMRFSLAHELGHLIMHRFPTPNMEQEANAFAVALLMPAADIRPYFLGKKVDLSTLAALKPEWRVSMAALLMRAHKLGFITENQYTYLWKQISARGYRLREPPELDFAREEPQVLKQIIELHLGALGYSAADLASMVHMHEVDFRSLYSIPDSNGPPRRKFTVLR